MVKTVGGAGMVGDEPAGDSEGLTGVGNLDVSVGATGASIGAIDGEASAGALVRLVGGFYADESAGHVVALNWTFSRHLALDKS